MGKSLNFNTIKKQYLTVTLPDKDKTTLMVSTPTKAVMAELVSMGEALEELRSGDNLEIMDQLYDYCARLLSCNKTNTKITKKDLEGVFDIEDLVLLFNTYTDFVNEVYKTKN